MRKLFVLIVGLLTFTSITSAANSGDCGFSLTESILAGWDENNTDNAILANLATAMPKDTIEKAYEHLKAYCCDVNISTDCSQSNSNDIYPQSIYLFDHILDIYLRRLDAKEDENGTNLLYGLAPDEMGKEWRDFIIAHGNNVEGTVPLEIKDKFSTMRKHSTNVTTFMGDFKSNIKLWEDSFEENIQNYNNRTLWDKYNLACDVAKYISENKLFLDKINTEEYNACKKLTAARINNETVYTQLLLMQKANVLLGSNMKSYLSNYFISTKLTALQEKVFNMATSFAEVNNAVGQLIPECNS